MMNHEKTELSTYLNGLAAFDVLSREEEVALATAWRERRDPRAGKVLVERNLRAVVKIAGEFRGHGVAFSDLIQEGNMGLLRALDRFDPDRGVRFLSYAGWWVRACIKEYLLRHRSMVRMGTTQKQRMVYSRLGRVKKQLAAEERDRGRKYTYLERLDRMSEILGIDATVIAEMEGRLSGYDLSLNTPVGEDGGTSFLDLVEDGGDNQEARAATREARAVTVRHLEQALTRLTEKERDVITRRFFSEEKPTLKEIGVEYGVSRERIRQIEAKALGKLRKALTRQGFHADLGELLPERMTA